VRLSPLCLPETPPPGPFRREWWRSPLRGPWLTALLGSVLLLALPLIILTGLLSYVAYSPDLGRNDIFGGAGPLGFFAFEWPTSPAWLYALNQGVHVTLGIVTIPIVLAKLWSVIPKLFEWPPVRSPAHALERLSLALLVGGILFELVTGVLNVQIYYPWKFSFVQAHLYGAWVFISAFALHVGLKLPLMLRQLRGRGVLSQLREDVAHTRPEPEQPEIEGPTTEPHITVPVQPAAATVSRRGLLALVGGSSLSLLALTAGQSIGGPLRRVALLAPHGQIPGAGPNGFQVNKTAAAVGVTPRQTERWSLRLMGSRPSTLTREQLLALPQHTEHLPIACVEGWSTTQSWTGVRLRDLARMAGMDGEAQAFVQSLQKRGLFAQTTLAASAVADERSLLALKVNGADLSLDHGFPARVIVPALPGVHCTKWVDRLSFSAPA